MSATLRLDGQTLVVAGYINFDNAEQVYRQGIQLLSGLAKQNVLLDLSQLQSSNTIGLAVFIQWLRNASIQHLKLVNVPEKMTDIIRASSLLEIFDL
jgi:phospholipid transport system transporter-binding protein